MAQARRPGALEPRFCRPVVPRVAHRLPALQQACLAESLERCRQAHQSVHSASAVLGEALEFQVDLRRAARAELQATIAAATMALEALG